MYGQFVGYVDLKPLPSGFVQLMRVTDFSNPHCTHKASNVVTKMPETRPQAQVFLVNRREFNGLHRDVDKRDLGES